MATPSALVNSPGQPLGVLTKEAFADFVETNFDMVHEDMMKAPVEGLEIYKEESTNLDHVKETALVGFGTMPLSRDSQKLPLDSPLQGFDISTTPQTYRLALQIEDALRETGQYGLIGKLQRAFIQSSKDTIELHAVLPLNTTFGSTVPFVCGDGLALVDTARNLENKSGTWTNQETTAALTQNSLETMDNNFALNVNGRGLRRSLKMKYLIVPRNLRRKALELTQSDKRPEDNLNAKNIFSGAFDVVVLSRLTSATAWFGTIDMDDPNYQLGWLWGAKASTKSWVDGSNPDLTWQRIRMKFATKCARAHGIRGNPGA